MDFIWQSPTWWTWVWVSSGIWWWTGKSGMLKSMGSQRVGHDWVTVLNWYDNWWQPAQLLDQEEGSKHFPGPKLHQKEVMLTVWWSAVGLIDPLQFSESAKPLHLRSMLSKLLRCTENCNACSQHWSTERAQFFSAIRTDCTLHNHCFKSWMNWAMKFYFICHFYLTSHQPTIPFSTSQQLFVGKNIPQPRGCRKCFPRIHWILKHTFLCYRNRQTYFSLKKKCWL